MASYRLTKAADDDLDRLFVFGFATFGLEQAEDYAAGLYERFDELCASPKRWPQQLLIFALGCAVAFMLVTRFITVLILPKLSLCEFWVEKIQVNSLSRMSDCKDFW